MITLRVAILGLVLAALAAGCGSSGPKVVTVTSTATGSSSSTSSSTGPSAKTLADNTDTVIGSFRCQSRSTGVVCTNTGDRHGFFISFEAYRIF